MESCEMVLLSDMLVLLSSDVKLSFVPFVASSYFCWNDSVGGYRRGMQPTTDADIGAAMMTVNSMTISGPTEFSHDGRWLDAEAAMGGHAAAAMFRKSPAITPHNFGRRPGIGTTLP